MFYGCGFYYILSFKKMQRPKAKLKRITRNFQPLSCLQQKLLLRYSCEPPPIRRRAKESITFRSARLFLYTQYYKILTVYQDIYMLPQHNRKLFAIFVHLTLYK